MDVAGTQRGGQRRRPALGRLVERLLRRSLVARRAIGEPRDRRCDQLDVADLLGADAVQQVRVRFAAADPRKLNDWKRYCIIVRISPN
jgi:hypothetical protein